MHVWSIRILGVEYDYTNLSHGQFSGFDTGGNAISFSAHSFDEQRVLGRVSYKFDWDRYVPLK